MLCIIKAIILILFCLVSSYLIGSVFTKEARAYNFAIGFCIYMGILELFGFWVVAVAEKKIYFESIALIIYAVFMILAIRRYKVQHINIAEAIRKNYLWMGITFVLIVLVIVFFRSDADDSFYVSNATLFQNSVNLNAYDSSFGIKELGTVPMYDFQVWESLIAVLSSMFRLEAVSVMHLFILPVLLILSASAYLFLGSILLKTDKIMKCTMFYLGLTIFHLFGGYAVYSEGSFLLSRQWQGKAVYLTIILPVMTAILLKTVKEQKSKKLWAQLAACILAGMALNPTSLYVMGFELLFMGVVITIVNKQPKYLLHITPAACIVVLFTVMIYFKTKQYSGQIAAASITNDTFVYDTFRAFWGSGIVYLLFYFCSACIIWWKGTMEAKIFSVYTPALLGIFIWNPYLGRYVAEHVTMVPSYWRVFWLLPVGASIVYAGCIIYHNCRVTIYKYIVILVTCAVLCIPGKWMFSKTNGFQLADNTERIPKDVIQFGENIISENDNAIVLGGDIFATTLRQKYANIELIYSRNQYILDLFWYRGEIQQTYDRSTMMNFANGKLTDFNGVSELLNSYKVDYLILSNDLIDEQEYLLSTKQWEIKSRSETNILFVRI